MVNKRKRGGGNRIQRPKPTCVHEMIEREGTTFYVVQSRDGRPLFKQTKPAFQGYDRDVHFAVTQRWINKEGCASLNTRNVGLRDNTAFLPLEGNRRDYPTIFLEYLIEEHGTDGDFRARDDLYRKLMQPNLSLQAFKNIYFHPFFQSEEELSEFPARVVDNVRYKKFRYWNRRQKVKWFRAFNLWERRNYQTTIDLVGTVMVDLLALRVYVNGNYTNTPASEARLVRNIIHHLNEHKVKDGSECYEKTEICQVIYDLFPDIAFRHFDFCDFCGVDLDFTKVRKFYKA